MQHNMDTLIVYRFNSDGPTISQAYEKDAGFDLTSTIDINLNSFDTQKIPTNIGVIIPSGCYGRVAERSGLALKGLRVGGGVIDEEYRGEVCVIATCLSKNPITIKKGDKIAQLIIEERRICKVQEVTEQEFFNTKTDRGEKGFGSSDISSLSDNTGSIENGIDTLTL